MTVRVVLQGFGAMGQECVRALSGRHDAEVVCVMDTDPHLIGRPVGSILATERWGQLPIQDPSTVDLVGTDAHVAVHTTTAFAQVAVSQIEPLLSAGMDVVTLCQELVYPVGDGIAPASRLDRHARATGHSVVAGGVNPGWILDALVVAASLGCVDISAVSATRVVDFSPYGPDEMVHIGADLDPESFERGAASGLIGHIGLRESAQLVADALGLAVDDWQQTKEPVLARREHRTRFTSVKPGRARGFRQRVEGWTNGSCVVNFAMTGLLDVDPADPELGDRIKIHAKPDMDITVHGDDTRQGGQATAGVVTNLIGPILPASPGLHTVLSLPPIRSRTTLRLPSAA